MRKLFYESELIDVNFRNGKVIKWIDSIGKKIHFIYDDIEGDIQIIDYDKELSIVTYKYNDIIYKQTSTALKNCQLAKMLFNEFKYNVGDILYNEHNKNIKIIGRCFKKNKRQRLKIYQYECLNCGFNGEKNEPELGITWCPCCCSAPKVVLNGVNDITKTDPWMIPYFQGGYDEAKLYTSSSSKRIHPICPLCNRVKNKAISICQIYASKSIGCSCGDNISYPNKFMTKLLDQINIKFISEYSPSWIQPKRYDFYIPSFKLIIEMDGGLGHGKNVIKISGDTNEQIEEKRNQSLILDYKKDELALKHNCKVIRIDAVLSQADYIKYNIMNSDISQYFDLSNIDWNMCDEYATKNIIKELCDLYVNNMDMTYQDISEIFHISKCTVGRYLKRGLKFGWISQKQYKLIIYNHKNQKNTYVYDSEYNLLNIFKSSTELSKQSEELYGIKFTSGGITYAAYHHSKYHDKYYISYEPIISEQDFINMIS